jgi:hypothetical protein
VRLQRYTVEVYEQGNNEDIVGEIYLYSLDVLTAERMRYELYPNYDDQAFCYFLKGAIRQ